MSTAGQATMAAEQRDLVLEEGPAGAVGLILHVAGELDISSVPRLRDRLDRAVDAGVTAIVLDLERVTFIDSVSLATVVAARFRLGPDGRLAIVAPTPFVSLVLQASGLDQLFDVFDDRAAAVAFAFG